MSEMTCRWNGKNEPRIVANRHLEDCEDCDACRGCQPCTESHCGTCGRNHAPVTCSECVGEARDDLAEIGALCRSLPAEVAHRGVNSEAMALLAPAADAEAWGHITTSLHVGRIPVGYLACDSCDAPYPCERHADGELHPLSVLGTWEFVWRDALDHETEARVTIPTAVAYLDAQMTYMAGFTDAPFEDFARDLRRCRAHLEAVLHDGEQRETGAPCIHCATPLRKVYRGRELPWTTTEHPALAHEDGWACPRCPFDRRWSNNEQYKLAVKAEHTTRADWLTAEAMHERTTVKATTVRSWASERPGQPAVIRKRLDAGRTVYSVEDVKRVAQAKGILSVVGEKLGA